MAVQAKRLTKESGEINEANLKQPGNQLLSEENGNTYSVTLILQQRENLKKSSAEGEGPWKVRNEDEDYQKKSGERGKKKRKLEYTETGSEEEASDEGESEEVLEGMVSRNLTQWYCSCSKHNTSYTQS